MTGPVFFSRTTASWGFLCLADAHRMVPATNPRSRVPLPPQPAVRIGRRSLSCCGRFTSLNALLSSPGWRSGELGFDHPGNRPDEADQLARDRHDDLGRRLAGSDQLAVARRQSHLRLPGDGADRLGQLLQPVANDLAHAGWEAIGP